MLLWSNTSSFTASSSSCAFPLLANYPNANHFDDQSLKRLSLAHSISEIIFVCSLKSIITSAVNHGSGCSRRASRVAGILKQRKVSILYS